MAETKLGHSAHALPQMTCFWWIRSGKVKNFSTGLFQVHRRYTQHDQAEISNRHYSLKQGKLDRNYAVSNIRMTENKFYEDNCKGATYPSYFLAHLEIISFLVAGRNPNEIYI
jgi:hypothetical protein